MTERTSDNSGYFFGAAVEAIERASFSQITNYALRVMAGDAGHPLREGDGNMQKIEMLKLGMVDTLQLQTGKKASEWRQISSQYQVPTLRSFIQRSASGKLEYDPKAVKRYMRRSFLFFASRWGA